MKSQDSRNSNPEQLIDSSELPPEIRIVATQSRWRILQQEAAQKISWDGKLYPAKLRNFAILRAYGELWASQPTFQWMGLAHFASQHPSPPENELATTITSLGTLPLVEHTKTKTQDGDYWACEWTTWAWLLAGGYPSLAEAQSDYGFEALAMANTLLFLEMYPLHRYFQTYGFERLQADLRYRQLLHDDIPAHWWPVPEKMQDMHVGLKFGTPHAEILQGFSALQQGNATESLEWLTLHEHKNILKPFIYDHWLPAILQLLDKERLLAIQKLRRMLPDVLVLQGATIAEPFAYLSGLQKRLECVQRNAKRFEASLQPEPSEPSEPPILETAS